MGFKQAKEERFQLRLVGILSGRNPDVCSQDGERGPGWETQKWLGEARVGLHHQKPSHTSTGSRQVALKLAFALELEWIVSHPVRKCEVLTLVCMLTFIGLNLNKSRLNDKARIMYLKKWMWVFFVCFLVYSFASGSGLQQSSHSPAASPARCWCSCERQRVGVSIISFDGFAGGWLRSLFNIWCAKVVEY